MHNQKHNVNEEEIQLTGNSNTDDLNMEPSEKKTKVADEEIGTEFLNLNDDCILTIFEWLSLSNICSMSFTSKRMQILARYYYALKHPDVSVKVMIVQSDQDTIVKFDPYSLHGIGKYFTNCIRNIVISACNVSELECINIGPVYNFLESECYIKLNSLKLENLSLFNEDVVPSDNVKKQLESVQHLEIIDVKCAPSIYKSLVKYCINLKTLDMHQSTYNNDPEWLAYKYSFLETLKLPFIQKESLSVDNFIQRHKHLKNIICEGINTMKAVFRNLKHIDLDQFTCCLSEDDEIDLGDSFECYEHKNSIKWFEFDTLQSEKDITQMFLDEVNSVQPIHKLSCSIRKVRSSQGFPKLKQLKELNLTLDYTLNGIQIVEFFNDLSMKAPKLEELIVFFRRTKFEFKSAAQPLLRHSPQLKNVNFFFSNHVSDEPMFDPSDLFGLESIRRSTHGESKIEFKISSTCKTCMRQNYTVENFISPGMKLTVAVNLVECCCINPYCRIFVLISRRKVMAKRDSSSSEDEL